MPLPVGSLAVFPSAPLMEMRGRSSPVLDSMTVRLDLPVTGSTFSCMVLPGTRSPNLTLPSTSVMIGVVKGSQVASNCPGSTFLAVFDQQMGAVNHRAALPFPAGLAHDGKLAAPPVHDDVVALGILHHIQIQVFDGSPAMRARMSACSTRRLAVPPMWKVRMVSWVPGSPMDWAARMPMDWPISTRRPWARSRP
jgi:hypothetical protein